MRCHSTLLPRLTGITGAARAHPRSLCPPPSAQDAGSTLQYAAFFADCQHELTRVEQGRRLALAYNLVWAAKKKGGVAPPKPPARETEAALLAAARAWEAGLAAGGTQPRRLAIMLGARLAGLGCMCRAGLDASRVLSESSR
jgi:hypothetical protein